MNTYEKGIYKFLTSQEENFINAYEISSVFPVIRRELIKDFWEEVYSQLKKIALDKGIWEITISKDVHYRWSSCGLHLKTDNRFGFAYEGLSNTLDFGVWVKDTTINKESIFAQINSLEDFKNWKSSNSWPAFRTLEHNFETIETLKRILPSNRDAFAIELSCLLMDFAHRHLPLLKDIPFEV